MRRATALVEHGWGRTALAALLAAIALTTAGAHTPTSAGERATPAELAPAGAARASTPGAGATTSGIARKARTTATVKLSATFSPEKLGAGTTIRVGFQISRPAGQTPLAVSIMRFYLPTGLSVATSDLGLDTCYLAKLEWLGSIACPTNSLMGHGSAFAEVPFGSTFVTEKVRIALFSGPLQNGHPQLLFLAGGSYPVIADVVFSALVLPDELRYGSLIDTRLPLVASVPEGPDIALVGLSTTIGPAGITYYEVSKGKRVAFHPRGIVLPGSCPRGGFPFAVQLTFQDGSGAQDGTTVPCPRGHTARRRRTSRPHAGTTGAGRHHRP